MSFKKIESQASFPTTSEQPMTRELLYRMAQQKFTYIFLNQPNGVERVRALIEDNREEIEALGVLNDIEAQLQSCITLGDRETFVYAVFEILKPVIDQIFDNQQRVIASTPEEQSFVANELLTYDIKGDTLFIHVFSGGLDATIHRYTKGLSVVAAALEKHAEVNTVEAWSWIVARHPKILERMGFIVDKNDEEKPLIFGDEQGHASMSRENFLAKYLPKK